jgi:hypothetical protein
MGFEQAFRRELTRLEESAEVVGSNPTQSIFINLVICSSSKGRFRLSIQLCSEILPEQMRTDDRKEIATIGAVR